MGDTPLLGSLCNSLILREFAGGLARFDLVEVAVDGALQSGFVAGKLDERRERHRLVFQDSGFDGWGGIQSPLGGGNAPDEFFLVVANGVEAIGMILEEVAVFFGIAVDEVFASAEAVAEAIAAGCGFACGGPWAGGFLGILAIGVELSFGGHFGYRRAPVQPYLPL